MSTNFNDRVTVRFIVSLLLFLPFFLHTQNVPDVFVHSTVGKAWRASKYSKKYVFAYVYTEWSIPSVRMLDSTFTDKKVRFEMSSDYENVAIDAGRKKRFVEDYNIHIFPTMLVMDWTGEVLIRAKGHKTPDELLKTFEKTKSQSRFIKQSLDTILLTTNRNNILEAIDSIKYYKDDFEAKNLAKRYLDRKDTDWRDPVSMELIKDYFTLDKKYLRFISKYHFKFFERFDSISIKENIAFHVFLSSLKQKGNGRMEVKYKPVTIRLLISKTRRKIDYDELISSVRSSIKEDGSFWRYDLLSLLYYKNGDTLKSNQAIATATSIAKETRQVYDPTLPYIIDAIE